jgi:glycosyltransferase involved in cell wall biosynthesis
MGIVSEASVGPVAGSKETTDGLSIAIISFNEEANIARCIEAVQSIASEIVVVDSYSTDRTVEIATALGAKVFQEAWKGHVAQKNSALDKCSFPWILSLDCDEVVSPELRESVVRAIRTGDAEGYRLNRKTFFMGKWIEHAWYPDWKIRLIRRGKGRWGGMDPHDSLIIGGPGGKLDGDLHHYSFKDLRDCFERTIRYAVSETQSYDRDGRKATLGKLLVNPLHGFIKHYFFKKGFLDGRHGFVIAVINAIYTFTKYALLWEKQREQRDGAK